VLQIEDQYLTSPPKDGVYVRGLFLEAAAWDKKAGCLIEAEPMQLVCAMPTILFKPVENKKKNTKGLYVCPCYVYPNRASGSGRPSFVVSVDLKTGAMTSDHYVKRGTALLMSLDY
jgi:dynein heavy chain